MKVLIAAVVGIVATIGIIFGLNSYTDSYSDSYETGVVQEDGGYGY